MAINFTQLATSIKSSIQQLQTPRENRLELVKQYAGRHYSDSGTEKRQPTNLLELAVSIYVRQLAARTPRVIVNTDIRSLRPMANDFETVLNRIPKEISLQKTLQSVVLESLFSIGIVKIGLSGSNDPDVPDEPFVDLVTIDDYFVDMTARGYDAIQFEGNDYWLDLDIVKEQYGNKAASLVGDDFSTTGSDGNERADSVGTDASAKPYNDRIQLRDVWLPKTKELVTYAVTAERLLERRIWDGPAGGPYRKLQFSEVPGNLMPLAPTALWWDLNELANALFRKLSNQADSAKSIAVFPGAQSEEIAMYQRAKDGDAIASNGGTPESVRTGGIDQTNLAYFLQVRDIFSYLAGNLDSLGGLSPMSDTVGQDKLLTEAASSRVKNMADRVVEFTKEIYEVLAWYEWTDPVRERIVSRAVPGVPDQSVQVQWDMATRRGDFLDFNFDIDVHSMQDDSPSTKLQKLGMVFQQYVTPLLPIIQQQGGQVDVDALFSLIGKYADLPELDSIIKFSSSDMSEGELPRGNPNPTAKPAATTRTYERVNRPGATRSGKDYAMSQLLAGGNPQSDEKAGLFRGIS